MTNTARATVLKYEPNEWARVWKEKLVEHKFDIEQSLLFGVQGSQSNVQYTEGAVIFLTQYCNTFSLATGRKKVLGLDTTTINTVYGNMNVVRNIHLDGTNVKMLGINMKHCKYRPLIGNGVNRDTSVYVGVQTLENSGVDRRVDLILTEAGMEWSMPEAHAIWT